MNKLKACASNRIALLLCLLIPYSAAACEPILPLGRLLMGPNFFARSLLWLAIAVAVKSVTFVFFERRLPWPHAVSFMLLANLVTSCIGAVVWAAVASSALTLFALPIVYCLSITPAKRVIQFSPLEKLHRMSPLAVAAFFPLALIFTIVLFYCAEEVLSGKSYVTYWLLKFLFATLSLVIGIGLTTLWEEWIVSKCARRKIPLTSFFTSVGRANYITFGIVLLGAAIAILPQRLHSRGFIAMIKDWLLG